METSEGQIKTADPALLLALQEQAKKKLFEGHSHAVRRRLIALRNLQEKYDLLEAELGKEIEALERQYHARFVPLYNKRYEIVSGRHVPTESECEYEESEDDEAEEEDEEEESKDDASVNGIRFFWLTAMQNHEIFLDMIGEQDVEILSELEDVRLEYLQGENGFKLEFVFKPNDFFAETVLTKTFHIDDKDEYTSQEGSTITWKDGKDPTKKLVKNKKDGRQSVRARKSFFSFFDTSAEADLTGDALEDLEDIRMRDVEAGEAFKEELIPEAVLWYTGEAAEDDDEYDDEDYDDESLDADEDDDDSDDEASASPNATKDPPRPAECNQQ